MFRYAPHNLREARAEADRYRVTLSYTGVGRLRVAQLTDTHGTEILIGQQGIAATCLTLVTQGSMGLVSPDHHEELIADEANGLIYRGRPGTRVLTSDNDARLNLWIPDDLLRPALERLALRSADPVGCGPSGQRPQDLPAPDGRAVGLEFSAVERARWPRL